MTSQPQDKYVLRMPDGMRDRIKEAAKANGRSMNAEIVATLEEAYPEPEPALDPNDISRLMLELHQARDEAELRRRVDEANRKIAAEGHPIHLAISEDRDERGLPGVHLTIR